MGAAGWGDLQGRGGGWVAEPVCKQRGGLCEQGPARGRRGKEGGGGCLADQGGQPASHQL